MRNNEINLTPEEVKDYVGKLHQLTLLLEDIRKDIGKKTAEAEEGWNDENYRLLAEYIEGNSKILDNITALTLEFCKATKAYATIIEEGAAGFKRDIKSAG